MVKAVIGELERENISRFDKTCPSRLLARTLVWARSSISGEISTAVTEQP
jgi:hypothetical protein